MTPEDELTRAEFGAEVRDGAVRGVRAFMFDAPGRPGLSGMWGVPFSPGVNTAACYYGAKFKRRPRGVDEEHHSPDLECSCGFYAYQSVPDYQVDHAPVLGAVEGWGEVLAGSLGWRSECIRLLAVTVNHRAPEVAEPAALERLGQWYQVEVLEDLDALLAEFKAPE